MGMFGGSLPGDHAVILAFGRDEILDLRIGDIAPRRNGNVLYYVPVDIGIEGQVTFSSDLRSELGHRQRCAVLPKDRLFLSMGAGTATIVLPADPVRRARSRSARSGSSLGTGGNGVPADRRRDRAARRDPRDVHGRHQHPSRGLRRRGATTSCPRSRCSTWWPGDWARLPQMTGFARLYARGSGAVHRRRPRASCSCGSSTRRPTRRSASGSRSRSRESSNDDAHRRGARPGQALQRHASRSAGVDLSIPRGRDLRPRRPERRGQDDDAPDARDAPPADVRRCRDRRRIGPPEPAGGPPRPRLHAGRVRGLRRHEGLGVPGLLRSLLRARAGPAQADDRRPAGAGRPRVEARRLRPEPVAGHAAAPVPRARARPRSQGAPPRRAGVRPRPARPRRAPGAPPRAPRPRQDHPDQQPHPPRARGAVHLGRDRRSRPGARGRHDLRDRPEAAGRRGAPGPRARRRGGCRGARAPGSRGSEDVASASIDAGQIEIGFRGDEAGAAELLAAAIRAKIRVASYSPAATDLQELFLQVTDRDDASRAAAAAAPDARPRRGSRHDARLTRLRSLRLPGRVPRPRFSSGISAIIVKELRGRMRGRRAFIIITLHVLLLAVFAWMFMRILEESNSADVVRRAGQLRVRDDRPRASSSGSCCVQTLMVAVLAPAATAGAISSEREHQTLELLAVTPISSLAIVLGKLVSALAWLFVLILASIPVTALVFVFGGVAPDDVLRGYVGPVRDRHRARLGRHLLLDAHAPDRRVDRPDVRRHARPRRRLRLPVGLPDRHRRVGQHRPPPAAARGDPLPQPVRRPDGRRVRHRGRRLRRLVRDRDRDRRPADRAGLPPSRSRSRQVDPGFGVGGRRRLHPAGRR